MAIRVVCKYNFSKCKSSNDLHSYYDKENVVSLRIIKSGWKGKYDCILEWGEYEQADVNVFNGEQIRKYYGIYTFSRIEKLKKINENTL